MPDSPAGDTPAFYDDLNLTLIEACRLLTDGAAMRDVPCHTPTLATIGLDGLPRVRTIVLRGFDQDNWTVRIHTDARSSKVPEIRANPAVAVHAYDPGRKIQLQLTAGASLHCDDDIADEAWRNSPLGCRLIYRGVSSSGRALPSPYDAIDGRSDDADAGRQNFCVVLCRVRSLEWLYLNARGHRRARFVREGERVSGSWLVP